MQKAGIKLTEKVILKSIWKYIVGLPAAVIIILVFIMSPYGKTLILKINRAKWEEQNISHYRFKLDIICLCPFQDSIPMTIEVRDGQIISVKDINGMDLDKHDLKVFERAGTIERLFDIAKGSISKAFSASVSYNAEMGFPDSIESDWDENVYDDEITYKVSEFEVLP